MTRILSPILLVVLLFPSLALGGEVKYGDLVERDGLFYKKFNEVPFSGTVTGGGKGEIKNGKWDGPFVIYHKNGQLKDKGDYKDGFREDGPRVSYWENGQLYSTGTYKDGYKDGPFVFYNEDGSKRFAAHKMGSWVDEGTGTYKNGKKVK